MTPAWHLSCTVVQILVYFPTASLSERIDILWSINPDQALKNLKFI